MTEIIEETDLTASGADGWQLRYRVRRNDGEEVMVEASCTRTSEAMVAGKEPNEAVEFIEDRGRRAAVHYAEHAQSPAYRGTVIVRVYLDGQSDGLSVHYDYERSF